MVYLFAKIGFAFLFAAFAASFLPVKIIFIFTFVLAFSGIFLRFLDKKSAGIAAVLIAAAVGSFIVGYELNKNYYPAMALDGLSAKITGTVTEVSAAGGNPVYTVKTDYIGIEGALQKTKIKVTGWDDNSAKPFDKISCEAVFASYTDEKSGEAITDRSRGISLYAYTETPFEIIGKEDSSFGYYIYLVRSKISAVIYKYFIDWHAPFMDQLLIGNRGELDSDILSSFRKSGMSHILAISGMHLSILIGNLEKLLRLYKKKRLDSRLRDGILIAATVLYMVIGGLGPSVFRSGIMLSLHYLLRIVFRGSKAADNIGIAVIIILLFDPMICCDPGFLMSVITSFCLGTFAMPFKELITAKFGLDEENRVVSFILSSVAVSIIAPVAVLPVSMMIFGEVSLLAPISNIIASFFANLSLIFGFLTVIFGLIPFLGFFAGGTAFIAMLCDGILLEIAEIFSFSYIEASSLWLYIWVIGSAVLMIIPAVKTTSLRYIPHALACSAFIFAMGVLSHFIFFSGVTEIKITAFEHGTAVSCSKDGGSVLIVHGLDSFNRFDLDFSGGGYDVIISLDALSGPAEMDIVSASKPKTALLTFEDTAERYEHAKAVSPGEIEIWEDGKVEIISSGVFCAEFDEISLLYISEECDIMDIEPKFRKAEIIILDGVSPEDFPVLRSKYMILRKMGGFYSGASELITLKSGEVSFAAKGAEITKGWNLK